MERSMPTNPLSLLFDSQMLFLQALVGTMLVVVFTMLMLPSILRAGSKAEEVAKAAYGYIAQTIGIFLMTVSGLPAFYAAFGYANYSNGVYAGLLTVFAVGGILYLWQDDKMRHVDPASRLLPQVIFIHLWKLIGLVAMLAAGISCAFFLFTNTQTLSSGWWIMYAGLFLYGLLISWLTFERSGTRGGLAFRSTPMFSSASAVKKPSVRKTKKKVKIRQVLA